MIELRFPLRVNANGSFESVTAYEQVWKQRVLAAVSTSRGTRVMRPFFGAELNQLTFMSSTDALSMATDYVGSVFLNDLRELYLESTDGYYDENTKSFVLNIRFRLPNKEEMSTIVHVNTDALTGGEL